MTKVLYIIAGANGSGKSTLAGELLPEEQLEFLNADDIAREICPENIESVRISAGKEVYKRLESYFNQEISFAIETTLAGSNHLKTIKKAKNLNYEVTLIYSFVDSPEICINRIKTRVLKGGHHIPDEDVIRRFYRSKNNFWNKYKDTVDNWMIFYNGIEKTELIANGTKDDYNVLDEATFELLIKDVIQ
ncbi:MAG: AAA family ATPase [bacterium]